MEFRQRLVSVQNLFIWNTSIYDVPYLTLRWYSCWKFPLLVAIWHVVIPRLWWPLGQSEGQDSRQVQRPRLFSSCQCSFLLWSDLYHVCRLWSRELLVSEDYFHVTRAYHLVTRTRGQVSTAFVLFWFFFSAFCIYQYWDSAVSTGTHKHNHKRKAYKYFMS